MIEESKVRYGNRPKFLSFKNKYDADEYIAKEIIAYLSTITHPTICLSANSMLSGVYEQIINQSKEKNFSFLNTSVFLSFEFTNLTKNDFKYTAYYFLNEHLFKKINLSHQNIFLPIQYDIPLENNYEVSEYDNWIAQKNGIDLLLLSIDKHGQISGLQVGTEFETHTHTQYIQEHTGLELRKTFNCEGLTYLCTVGFQTILKAKKIILVAYGYDSGKPIYNMFFSKMFYDDWPLTALLYSKNITVICDEQAIEYVKENRIQ